MKDPNLKHRDMSKLAAAALTGLIAAGCSQETPKGSTTQPKGSTEGSAIVTENSQSSPLLSDPHVCRGINTCKNKGKKGTTNECAGLGQCATASAHACNGHNECRGQGGCGEKPGQNECKGKGACEVPLSTNTWPKARKKFEELMTSAGKKFGKAP